MTLGRGDCCVESHSILNTRVFVVTKIRFGQLLVQQARRHCVDLFESAIVGKSLFDGRL